jgi:hypothetical protein
MNKEPVTIVLKNIPSEIVNSIYLFVDDILSYNDRDYTIIQAQDTGNNYKIKVRLK